MSDFERAHSADRSHLPKEIDGLFQQYFATPGSPRVEEIRRLAEELLLRNKELEAKVGNFKTIAQQLEKYRDRYVDLYELAPAGYATLDEEGYVQEINLAGSELLGAQRDELIGYPIENYVAPKDREGFLKQVRRCCCERQVLTCDVELVAKDGKAITAHLRGVPLESLEAEATFCKIAITDITERSLAEAAIRASEANYRAIFDTANDAIFVHDVHTGAILDANQRATEMYGYTTEEFRQANVEILSEGHPPYSQDDAMQWIQQAVAGIPQRFDWKAKDKKGKVFWTGINLKKTTLNGKTRLLAIVRDITERKETEEARRKSEERFRTVADYTYDWEYWRGQDSEFCYISPSCQRITGYSPEEFLADPALLERIIHPEDREELKTHLRSKGPHAGLHKAEYRIISRSGEERWIEHICQPVYGVDQRWLGRRASNRDITNRKREELALMARIEELERKLSEARHGL